MRIAEIEDLRGSIRLLYLDNFDTSSMNRMAKNPGNVDLLIEALWAEVIANIYPYQWRAAWFLEHVIAVHPHKADELLQPILDVMAGFNHEGQYRHCLKIILLTSQDAWDLGLMYDLAYTIMMDEKHAPAVRVHAMEIVSQVVKKEPDLNYEFVESLRFIYQNSTAGLKSRINRILATKKKERG
ncbi:MAG: hypothetical protein JXR34_02380 [Bacteroidales bacterium]|nr:hypothetical protein [Bacteroidales bacterium]